LAQVLLSRLRLIGVVTDHGLQVGRLVDLTFDETDGRILSLLVKPASSETLANVPRTEDGNISIPFGAVMSIRDYIVVNERVLAIQRLKSTPTSPTE
jgi:sporulation protein YlmC with PRC-barrel domain